MTYGSKKEYAAHRDVSPAYISKKGIKELVEQAMEIDPSDGKKKINFERADQILADAADPARADFKKSSAPAKEESETETKAQPSAPAPGSYHDGKTRLAQINAEKAELDLLERKKGLLPVTTTIAAIAAAGSLIKEHLQGRNTRIAESASSMTNPREIKAMLDADDRVMFETINNDFQQRLSSFIGEGPTTAAN